MQPLEKAVVVSKYLDFTSTSVSTSLSQMKVIFVSLMHF